MTANVLLRFYPPAWRKRYGEEFLETVGHGALHVQQIIDILAGAIDAWLSSDVRRSAQGRTGSSLQPRGAGTMSHSLKAVCGHTTLRFGYRDSWIGAGVMIGATFAFLAIGIFARRNGMPVTGEILKSLAFPGSMMLSMPFTFLKGQPWRAQVVIVGGTMLMLVLIGYLAVRF